MNKLLEKYYGIIRSPLKELTLSQLYNHIQKDGYKISLDFMDNIYVKNTKSENKILVVAHLDRVLEKAPRLFRYETEPKKLYGAYGWDDRAGVIAALELFKNNDIDLLFTTGEESGCAGAKQVNPNKIRQYEVIFELDRHGDTDFVNDCSMGLLCNDDFTNAICYYIGTKGMVLKPTHGVYTDVGALRDINKTAQMFYMSCGYYNEHTEQEYLVPEEFERSITVAQHIIDFLKTYEVKSFIPEERPIKDDGEYYYYCPYCDEYFMENELERHRCPMCGGGVECVDLGEINQKEK